jgi:alpha-L-rhamnosidase
VVIQPHPSKRLNYAKASFESPYGTISSGWERKEGKLIFKVRIPSNTTATIALPVNDASKITEGGKAISLSTDFTKIRTADKNIMFEAGSGDYVFEIAE